MDPRESFDLARIAQVNDRERRPDRPSAFLFECDRAIFKDLLEGACGVGEPLGAREAER